VAGKRTATNTKTIRSPGMKDHAENKRKYERFKLVFPATLEAVGSNSILNFHTRDISAGGAYFETSVPMKMGVKLEIEIIITNGAFAKLTGTQPKIKAQGKVIRSEPQGMAVSFTGHEKIMPLRGLRDN
jgi:hypothetical protein